MKIFRLLPILAALSVTAGALGQGADPFDVHVSDMKILTLKMIQKEIGLTEAQRSKMNAASTAEQGLASAELKRSKGKPDQKKMLGYYTDLRQKVFAVLTPPQVKRLRELTLQETGLVALANQEVATRVGLSAAGLKKIRDIIVSHQKQFETLESNAKKPIYLQYKDKNPKNEAEATALKKEFAAKMQAVDQQLRPQVKSILDSGTNDVLHSLTPAQKAAWTALMGKPFNGKIKQ